MTYTIPQVEPVHFSDFVSAMPDVSGKTFVVTGTTTGTGRIAARTLASKGGRVIMLNRPSARAHEVQETLAAALSEALVLSVDCDLQSFASVRAAAERVRELCAESGIDVLINNAGIMAMPDEATEDGFDTQMQTNHLSHFLLTQALFDLLEQAAEARGEARIVNHSSVARKSAKRLEAKYLEARGGQLGGNGASMMFGGARWARYSQTKLANAAFTAALHERLRAQDSKVKALVAHPGWANTQLQRRANEKGGLASWNSWLARMVSQSEEDGTLGILSCAVLADAQCGQFYGPGAGMMATRGEAKPFALERQYDTPETRRLLWDKSSEAIGADFRI